LQTKSAARFQSATIVAGEMDSRKKAVKLRPVEC
jgi:hypothetical protein